MDTMYQELVSYANYLIWTTPKMGDEDIISNICSHFGADRETAAAAYREALGA